MASFVDFTASLGESISPATSQGWGIDFQDATLSVVLVIFHFSLLRLWRHWRIGSLRRKCEEATCGQSEAAETTTQNKEVSTLATSRSLTREETFCKVVMTYQQCGNFIGAAATFHEFREELVHFHQAPALLLNTFRMIPNDLDDSTRVWNLYQATKDHVDYSKAIYYAVISILSKNREVDHAMEVLRDMILQDIEVDNATYGQLIRMHLARGDLESSVQLLSQMQRQKVAPDFATFQAVLEAAAQRQLPILAEEILQNMEQWSTAGPSSATLATMLRLYGRSGDLGKAFQIFREMPKKFGFQVDSHAFASMLCILVSEGEINDAFDVYDDMLAAGYEADASCFKALLCGSLQHGDLDTAARLISDAQDRSRSLSRESLELFFLQAARRGRGELAKPILEEAQRAGVLISERIVNSVHRAC